MDKEYSDLCKELENPKSVSYDFMNNTLNIPNPRCPIPKVRFSLLKNFQGVQYSKLIIFYHLCREHIH